VLRAIDKMDKFPPEEVRKLLGPGRRDESGDFTKGAGLREDQIETLLSYTVRYEGGAFISRTKGMLEPLLESGEITLRNGHSELLALEGIVRAADYGPDRIRIDPSVVRGLEYYTGPVYEVELTFEVKGEDGRPVRFGSVGGGGRYDGLVGRFREGEVPATGISIGVSRLLAALTHLGKLPAGQPDGPVVVTVMDRARIAEYQVMVTELRNAGIRAELYLGDGGFKPQLKYADRRNAPLAIIQGSDEAEKGLVQIKDLKKGAELAALSKFDREAYLAKQAEAQRLVPSADLVPTVRAMLAG
jgi:histidyl-tRNA synthetase